MWNRKQSLVLAAMLMTSLCLGDTAWAQSEDRKLEVGIQFAVLRHGLGNIFDDTSGTGGGGRITYDLNRNLAVEAEMNYFPGSGYYDVRRLQGQIGLKSGVRYSRFGVFGKLRPGFLRNSYEIPPVCIQGCTPIRGDKTNFSLDLGGVMELYPANRVTVRFDLGDLISKRLIVPNPVALVLPGRQERHALQINAGIGFRF